MKRHERNWVKETSKMIYPPKFYHLEGDQRGLKKTKISWNFISKHVNSLLHLFGVFSNQGKTAIPMFEWRTALLWSSSLSSDEAIIHVITWMTYHINTGHTFPEAHWKFRHQFGKVLATWPSEPESPATQSDSPLRLSPSPTQQRKSTPLSTVYSAFTLFSKTLL